MTSLTSRSLGFVGYTAPLMGLDVFDRFVSETSTSGERKRPLAAPNYTLPRVHLVAQFDGTTRLTLPAPLRLVLTPTRGQLYAIFGQVIFGRSALRDQPFINRDDMRVNVLKPGVYCMELTHPYYRTVVRRITLHDRSAPDPIQRPKPELYSVRLEPSKNYPFFDFATVLMGKVTLAASGDPMPGAQVTVELRDVGNVKRVTLPYKPLTDENGEWIYPLSEAVLEQHIAGSDFTIRLQIEPAVVSPDNVACMQAEPASAALQSALYFSSANRLGKRGTVIDVNTAIQPSDFVA